MLPRIASPFVISCNASIPRIQRQVRSKTENRNTERLGGQHNFLFLEIRPEQPLPARRSSTHSATAQPTTKPTRTKIQGKIQAPHKRKPAPGPQQKRPSIVGAAFVPLHLCPPFSSAARPFSLSSHPRPAPLRGVRVTHPADRATQQHGFALLWPGYKRRLMEPPVA